MSPIQAAVSPEDAETSGVCPSCLDPLTEENSSPFYNFCLFCGGDEGE